MSDSHRTDELRKFLLPRYYSKSDLIEQLTETEQTLTDSKAREERLRELLNDADRYLRSDMDYSGSPFEQAVTKALTQGETGERSSLQRALTQDEKDGIGV